MASSDRKILTWNDLDSSMVNLSGKTLSQCPSLGTIQSSLYPVYEIKSYQPSAAISNQLLYSITIESTSYYINLGCNSLGIDDIFCYQDGSGQGYASEVRFSSSGTAKIGPFTYDELDSLEWWLAKRPTDDASYQHFMIPIFMEAPNGFNNLAIDNGDLNTDQYSQAHRAGYLSDFFQENYSGNYTQVVDLVSGFSNSSYYDYMSLEFINDTSYPVKIYMGDWMEIDFTILPGGSSTDQSSCTINLNGEDISNIGYSYENSGYLWKEVYNDNFSTYILFESDAYTGPYFQVGFEDGYVSSGYPQLSYLINNYDYNASIMSPYNYISCWLNYDNKVIHISEY